MRECSCDDKRSKQVRGDRRQAAGTQKRADSGFGGGGDNDRHLVEAEEHEVHEPSQARSCTLIGFSRDQARLF